MAPPADRRGHRFSAAERSSIGVAGCARTSAAVPGCGIRAADGRPQTNEGLALPYRRGNDGPGTRVPPRYGRRSEPSPQRRDRAERKRRDCAIRAMRLAIPSGRARLPRDHWRLPRPPQGKTRLADERIGCYVPGPNGRGGPSVSSGLDEGEGHVARCRNGAPGIGWPVPRR